MNKLLIIFISCSFYISLLANDKSIESVLKIKPPIKYYENGKYEEILKFNEIKTNEKNRYDLGVDIGINKELMTIDRLKIDIGTKFKGIN